MKQHLSRFFPGLYDDLETGAFSRSLSSSLGLPLPNPAPEIDIGIKITGWFIKHLFSGIFFNQYDLSFEKGRSRFTTKYLLNDYIINDLEDMVVFLAKKVFNSDNLLHIVSVAEIRNHLTV